MNIDIPLPAPKRVSFGNIAKDHYEALKRFVADVEKDLGPDETLVLFYAGRPVRSIGFYGPTVLTIQMADVEGADILAHAMSVVLESRIIKTSPQEPKRPIGFIQG